MRIVRRIDEPHRLLLKVVSTLCAIAAAGIFIALCGYNPVAVYREILIGSLGSGYNITQTVEQMIPLIIMGAGVAICFKIGFVNIGAEGQFCMGAIFATAIALFVKGLPTSVMWILMFAAAFAGGGLWCLIAGALKVKWGVSETLVTLMLTYIAIRIVSYLQYVAWKDPKSLGFPKIANYPEELQLPEIQGVNSGIFIAAALLIFTWFLFHRMKAGYEMSVMGASLPTARYAGINVNKVLVLVSMLGGGICGISGLIEASGVEHTLNDSMSGGMGYTAIVIAYMGGMEPLPILIVSFLFSILLQGGKYMQISMQISSFVAEVVQGVILLFVLGSEFFTKYRIVRTAGRKEAA